MAKILVVDDDPVTIGLIFLYLAKHEHDVTTAENGKEALALLHTETFDIVITDILMPEMDGYELLIRLLQQPTRPKIIAMSAGAPGLLSSEILETSWSLKVDATLTKPLTSDELNSVVDRLLKPHQVGAKAGEAYDRQEDDAPDHKMVH
jgi:CheY-like chemotaxis protein